MHVLLDVLGQQSFLFTFCLRTSQAHWPVHCVLEHGKDAVRKDDPLRGVDSARSNVTNVSQMTGQTTLTALSIDVENSDG